MNEMSKLTKIGDWYRGTIEKWETDWFGFEMVNGVSDLITNNMRLIKRTKDRTPWAYECLERCFDLLREPKRWPDDIDLLIPDHRQCKTRIGSALYKHKFRIAKRLNIETTGKFRSQGDMTRDPYIDALACAVDMGVMDFVHTVSIPWYLYRPTTWTWHKFLKDPTDKNYVNWKLAEYISAVFKAKDFVHELKRQRREAAEKVYLLSLP